MEIEISLPGGLRVDTQFRDHVVNADQPVKRGGDDSAPSPFELFLASIAACAGYYTLKFCQTRGISTDGIKLSQVTKRDPSTGMVGEVEIAVQLPIDFPERYRAPLIRAVELCSVKKHIEQPPRFQIRTEMLAEPAA